MEFLLPRLAVVFAAFVVFIAFETFVVVEGEDGVVDLRLRVALG